ncbi:17941_t:CDS:2, partial [Dentiscutata erythropus]
ELCQKKYDNPNLKGVELAKTYGITKYQRKSDYPNIEEALSIWVKQAIRNEFTLTGHLLQAKAKEFATLFEIT